ncbi:hypothetical protein HPB47_017654, partial [Ixodes persulcatus]
MWQPPIPPKRRKLYLDPSFDGEDLPRMTEYRASRAERANAQRTSNDGANWAVPTVPVNNGPSATGNCSPADSASDDEQAGDEEDDPERSVMEAVDEEHGCEDGGNCATPDADFSAEDLVTLVMDFAVTSGMPWTIVEKLMTFVSFILKRNDLPDTKFLFKKFAGISLSSFMFHFYCPDCMRLLGECEGDIKKRKELKVTCAQCSQEYTGEALTREGNFFVTLPVEQQLASVLSSEEVARSLKESLQKISDRSHPTVKGDITDGDLYCKQREELNLGEMDITMTVNSDGSPLFSSSKFSIWPVQMTINELPSHLRCKNLAVSVLWYGQCHPDMTLVLQAFTKQMDSLAQTGTVKYPVGRTSVPDRTKEEVESDMVEAFRTGVNVRGIKGPSPLINLPGFDIVWSFSPDYMHCVLLGVTRQFLELWLSNVGAAYYIGSPQLQKEIDERLCHIKPPQCMPRLPRSVKLRKYWKAVEWQQWLLYFSLVCTDSILPDRYLTHFSLLVRGIFLLLQDEVSTADISDSTDCLVRFVVGVQFLYSEKEMTSNVHQLLHLAKSVVLQGPLWAHSCFAFEASIGKLKSLVTSAKGVPHQVMTRIMM